MTEPEMWLILIAIFITAGFIKGAVAIGLPTASVAVLSLFFEPREAIALMLYPMFYSNALQAYRGGLFARSWQRYRTYIIVQLFVVIAILYLTSDISGDILRIFLGIVIVLFVVVSILATIPRIPDAHDQKFQIGFGSFAGVLGGIVAVWAAPIIIYLTARGVDKEEFARASGFMITICTLPLLFGYYQLGFLNGENSLISIAMLIPVTLGFFLGERLRNYVSEDFFRNMLLAIFAVLGANLVWQGFV